MTSPSRKPDRGPFVASQLRPGDRYELSRGHAFYCAPTGADGAQRILRGGAALATDPAVKGAGIDAGYTAEAGQLRAPDVSIGEMPDAPGWIAGTPPLAVEYASTGQDEATLRTKIDELLAAGTRWIWVVRLLGERHVEVHERGVPMRVVRAGDTLSAPGILQNDVPVEALWDLGAADAHTLRNLLQRHGYEDLSAVRQEGEARGEARGEVQGRARSVLEILDARGLRPTGEQRDRILACTDIDQLQAWLRRAATASSVEGIFE